MFLRSADGFTEKRCCACEIEITAQIELVDDLADVVEEGCELDGQLALYRAVLLEELKDVLYSLANCFNLTLFILRNQPP